MTLPSGPPFGPAPGATYGGRSVPQSDWYLFSVRGSAAQLVQQYTQAAIAAGLTITQPVAIVDGIANGWYSQFAVDPPASGSLYDVSVFMVMGSAQDKGGVVYVIADVAGLLLKRQLDISQAQAYGDTNYQQEGSGASTVNVAVPGVLTLQLLSDVGLAQARWAKASA